MSSRLTPYRKFRYPGTNNTIDPVDVQKLASDIDAGLVVDDKYRTDAFRLSGAAVQQTGAVSMVKNTLTTVTFNATAGVNNGANGGFGNAAWWSSTTNPSRLTAPTACMIYATAFAQMNMTTNLGTNGFFAVWITKNGATGSPQVQAEKYQPNQTGAGTGDINATIESAWAMAAGDYLEMKLIWNGTPVGPLSTEAGPTMVVQMVAVL